MLPALRTALAGSLALLAAQDSAPPEPGGPRLPDGPAAELLARLPEARATRLPGPAWPEWSDPSAEGWGGEPPWRRWVELVRAEAAAARPDPARRAQLCVLAHLQGRDGDAWVHWLACGADPALAAGLLRLLIPGVPPSELENAGPLPDGVLLRPALPPTPEPRVGLRQLAGLHAESAAFPVGAATCALSVAVDRDGLEVRVRHLSGGSAQVRVLPPLPRGVDAGLVFADWEKLPDHQGPLEFRLDAETNEHTLWLTFHPPAELWPYPRAEQLGACDGARAIVVLSPRGDEPPLRQFAQALGELLGVPAELRAAGDPEVAALAPLVVHLEDGPAAERKRVELIGLAEAFALRREAR